MPELKRSAFWFFGGNPSGLHFDAITGQIFPDIRIIPVAKDRTFDEGGKGAKILSQGGVCIDGLVKIPDEETVQDRSALRAWQRGMLTAKSLKAFEFNTGVSLPWVDEGIRLDSGRVDVSKQVEVINAALTEARK